MFGFPKPDGVASEYYWGARAIYASGNKWTNYTPSLDLLPDRQSYGNNASGPAKDDFFLFVNKRALPALRKWIKKGCHGTGSRQVFMFREGIYCLLASPNASYGYMYIGAFDVGTPEEWAIVDKLVAAYNAAEIDVFPSTERRYQ